MDWRTICIIVTFSIAAQSQCPKDYSGPTCSCGPCYNNATCTPTTGSFKCTCPPGVQGSRCRTIYTINFGEDAYLEMTNNYLYHDEVINFEFKTTLPDGLLLYQEGMVEQERSDHVILELVNGSLRISYNTDTVFSQTGYVGQALNDDRFHVLNLVLQNNPYQATLSVDKTHSVTVQGTQSVDFQDTNEFYLGGVKKRSASVRKNLVTGKSFVGCIKNFVQSQLVLDFRYELPLSKNVHVGCLRKDVCRNHGCKHGTCVDMWNRYECHCIQGYTSRYCEVQASMSFDALVNSSVRYFSRLLIASLAFEFNMKTGSGHGVMVYSGIVNSFQIGVSIVGDHLNIIYGQPGHWRFTRIGTNLTDGIWYQLNITINSGSITIQIDGVSKSVMVPSVNHIGQEIYFGVASANFSDLSQELRGPVFTGCIRQLSLNNVTVGLESGQTFGNNPLPKPGCTVDQRCSSSICAYRGTCKTTWDSTECNCDVGYRGDRCQNGTASTFNGKSSSLTLAFNTSYWTFGSSGSMKFRTRSAHGLLLYAGWFPGSQTAQEYVQLEIINRKLKISVNLGSGEGGVVIDRIVNDNKWHFLEWSRKYQQIALVLDNTESGESSTPGKERLLNVARNGEIVVNISGTTKTFAGCIKDLVLDTRYVNVLNPVSQPGLTVYSTDVNTSCVIHSLCHGYPCQNNGYCLEETGSPACKCIGNFTGTHCEKCITGHKGVLCDKLIDLCNEHKPCINGSCIFDPLVSINNYSCICSDGYTGRNCTIEIDECLVHKPCQNSARCVDGIANYSCICADGYAGRNCTIEIDECLVHKPCQNSARCVDGIANYSCICADGYTGRNCTIEVDECVHGIYPNTRCQHNGVCVDGLANYMCNCTGTGYRGLHCEIDINECILGSHECKNGTCVNTQGAYECDCFKFYDGTFCDNNTEIATIEPKKQASKGVEGFPSKFWWVIFVGLLVCLMCTVALVLYLVRKQTQQKEGVYLPGEEEIRMAKNWPILNLGLIDEESII